MATVKNIAKISAPSVSTAMPRPRLFALLNEQRCAPLVWIYGPPGAGKTTLAASYFADSGQQCLWYRVDSGDHDVGTFFYYVNLAVANALPKHRINLPLYTAESTDGLETFARSYFRQLFAYLDKGTALVFDNCHELPENSPLLSVFMVAIDELPEGINICCISRDAPPAVFSKLQVYDQCRELDWQALRFTIDESRELLRRFRLNYPDAGLAWLHEKTKGWVSGLILLARNARLGETEATFESLPESGALFGYLAVEVFEKLSPEINEFLMVAALLPEMTAASVQELTGNVQAARLLNDMAGKGYFLECSSGSKPVFQFHPLCRDFLLARGQSKIEPKRLLALQLQAAKLLEKQGNFERAMDLYRQLESWPELKRLLLEHAESWICSGRHRSLIYWLECIPEADRIDDEYLYWLGLAYVPVDAKKAYQLLEQAHENFLAKRNAEWSYRSWSAIVETIYSTRGNFEPLKKWIVRFNELRELYPYFFAPELKAKAYSSAVVAMSILDSQNPWLTETVKLSEYAVRLIPIELFQQAVLINLAYYYNFTGNLARFRVFAPRLKKALDNDKLPPAARILASVMLMLLAVCSDEDDAPALYEFGTKLAEQSGVHLFNGLLNGFNVYHYALKGELKTAKKLLDNAIEKTPSRFSHDFAHYSQIAAWLAALEGDTALAMEHNSIAIDLEEQLHYPMGVALSKDLAVQLLAKQRRWKEAEQQLDEERCIVESLASKCLTHKWACSIAWLAYLRNDEARMLKNLRQGFGIGSSEKILAWYGLLPEVMLDLSCKALEYGIETDYARQLISTYNLFPAEPPLHLENWPWDNHFYALGRFSILADGKELEYNGKMPLKALELLQIIIAFGGTQVDSLNVSEMLWPDAEGDNAQQALETALFRLRKLIGKDSVIVGGGKISLNRKRCWLDVWAFEQVLERVDVLLGNDQTGRSKELENCMALLSRFYRGPLFGDTYNAWAETARQRLQNKYNKALKRISAYYKNAENGTKAEYFLDKLAETGPGTQTGFYLQ